MTRFCWVADRKAEGFPITAACRVAEVSTSAFWDWCRRVAAGPTEAQQEEDRLVAEMWGIHDENDGTYGEPRMTPELRDRGFVVNHKRLERLMRIHGIMGVHKPPKVEGFPLAAELASGSVGFEPRLPGHREINRSGLLRHQVEPARIELAATLLP